MTIINISYDCANNNRKGICNTINIEANAFGTSTLQIPIARRPVWAPLLGFEIYLPPAISYNLLYERM